MQVVQLPHVHTHRAKGDEQMENRPCYIMQEGNTTIKIRSALPFMSPAEQAQWFQDNDSLIEVQMMKSAWANALWVIERQKQKSESTA